MLDKPPSSEEIDLAQQHEASPFETERMHDVLLLLENLLKREEATARVILECLYDVGSINLINRKVRFLPMNRLVKWIARLSKPAFRMIAMRWMRRNCPRLITNWLHSQVKFEPRKALKTVIIAPPPPSAELASQPQPVQTVSLVKLEDYNREIKRLHDRIKVLATLLIGVTVSLGGSILWSFLQADNLPQQAQQLQEVLKPCTANQSIRLIEACE